MFLVFVIGWIIVHYPNVQPLASVVGVAMLAYFSISSLRLKRVHLSGKCLHVSDYFRRVTIDLNTIVAVEPSLWWDWQPRTVKLTVDETCEFGSKIVFIPRGLGFFASEVANEIRAAKYAA
jgi:hypothetical protein